MPIVVFDNGNDTYTIIDGYHRYMCLKTFEDLKELNKGYIPVAVVKGKSRAELMASTIRHNRARGRHQIVRMPNIIMELTNSWDTKTISEELGMDEEEIKRIKLFSGYASLFKDVEYSKSWIPRQVLEVYLKEKGEKID
jgi:ParB-like chromosome segregation protein Spo0J